MSSIHNISATFLLAFKCIQGDSKLSPTEIFKSLSIMMGGDGETIKKKQLDKYIADAEAGKVAIDKAGLSALKTVQQDWYRITNGKDTINVADSNAFTALLAMAFAGSFTTTKTPDASSSNTQKTNEITDSTNTAEISAIREDTTVTDLKSMLKDALGGTTDTNDDSNVNLIATLTNMIAASTSTSTVSVEA